LKSITVSKFTVINWKVISGTKFPVKSFLEISGNIGNFPEEISGLTTLDIKQPRSKNNTYAVTMRLFS